MSSKYTYTRLGDAQPDTGEHYNFYATVVDATLPYKGKSKYVCSVKAMDPTIYLESKDEDCKSCVSIVIYAKRMEDLPVISKIGDIIRVHRATMVTYKDQKQFNVNVFYNSSWCLFNNDEEVKEKGEEEDEDEDMGVEGELNKSQFVPYKFSGKNFSFDKFEVEILSAIRGFSQAMF